MQVNVDLIFLCETWLGPEDEADCSLDTTWFSFEVVSRQSDTMLLSNIPPEVRSSFDSDRPIPTNPAEFSGSVFAEFQLVAEDIVKIIVQEMSKMSCDLDPMPTPVLYIVWMKFFPLWPVSIINKYLTSDIVPQCFKHALVKPLLEKASLDPNCLKHYHPISNLPFLSKVLERIVLKQFLQHLQSHSLLEPFQSAY